METKIQITKEEGIKDLKDILELPVKFDPEKGGEDDGVFLVNKMHLERFEVIERLHEYFKDKVFERPYALVMDSITLCVTRFEIKALEDGEINKLTSSKHE